MFAICIIKPENQFELRTFKIIFVSAVWLCLPYHSFFLAKYVGGIYVQGSGRDTVRVRIVADLCYFSLILCRSFSLISNEIQFSPKNFHLVKPFDIFNFQLIIPFYLNHISNRLILKIFNTFNKNTYNTSSVIPLCQSVKQTFLKSEKHFCHFFV